MQVDTEKELQRMFDFVVKHKDASLDWPSADIRKFLRWAAYYRRLFVIRADVKGGGKRIVALGTAWRTESPTPNVQNLDFDHTEFGNYLFIHQVIVHPDFYHTGIMFQLLSMALWRYPEVHTAFWVSEHSPSKRVRHIAIHRLLKALYSQVELSKLRPFIRRQVWEAEVLNPQFQMLKYVR